MSANKKLYKNALNVNLTKKKNVNLTKSTFHTLVFPTPMSVSKNENASNLAKVWRVVEKGGKYCASVRQSLRLTATFLELYWNAQTNSNFQAPPLLIFAIQTQPKHTLPKLQQTQQFSAF